jgi:ABC-2 type transport system ATP-binding protein
MTEELVDQADVMIDCQAVTKCYGSVVAVDHLSLQVRRGEICGFLGPNGAGKTTTLRLLLGLVRPTSGRIVIQGVDLQENPVAALNGVGAIIEESHFYPYLTGEQNLRQVLRARGLPYDPEVIGDRLAQVGLAEAARRRVKGYSLGMRQRLALAIAMIQDPSILILDEPMNGLDPAGIRNFRLHLLDLADEGVTILLSSHILSEVEQLATRLVFINRGRIVGVVDRHEPPEARAYVRAADFQRLFAWCQLRHLAAEPLDDGGVVVPLERPEEIAMLIRELVNDGIDVLAVHPYAHDLERQYLDRIPAHGEEVSPRA